MGDGGGIRKDIQLKKRSSTTDAHEWTRIIDICGRSIGGNDDAADALRHLVATKSRTIKVMRLRGL